MKKLMIMFMFLMLLPVVFASGSVSRSFSTSTFCNDREFNVILSVDVIGEQFYAIDETIPAGFVLVNSGGGDSVTNPPHVYWTVLQNAQDTTFTYTLRAPASPTAAQFGGTYGFESRPESQIVGSTQISVIECAPEPDDVVERLEELELWRASIDSAISSILAQIADIKAWLSFSSYLDLFDAVGGSPTTGCTTNAECGTDGYITAQYCDSGDVYKNYRTFTCSTGVCSHEDLPQLMDDCVSGEICTNGLCVSQEFTCSADSECGTDAFEGTRYCLNDDVYQNKRIYTCENPATSQSECSSVLSATYILGCDTDEVCSNGACTVPDEIVVFRTNALSGQYVNANTEIAVDYDGDGNLECYKYYTYYKSYKERSPVILAETPEGYNVNKYGTAADRRIIIGRYSFPIYKPAEDCTIPLTSVPESPYSTNGQEVYE